MSLASVASYVAGQCTAFVAQTLGWVPGGLGNANQWLGRAQGKGLQTTTTPTVGSVAAMNIGQFGHVGVVAAVSGNQVTLHDQNWDLHSGIATHTVNANQVAGYILAPGMSPGQGGGSPNPVQQVANVISDPFGAALGAFGSAVGAGVKGAGDAVGAGITGGVTSTGHGVADAITVTEHNAKTFLSAHALAMFVAAVIVLVVFLK